MIEGRCPVATQRTKRPVGRPPEWKLPEIDATPEELARAILTQPPRQPHEWPYMQEAMQQAHPPDSAA